MLMRLGQEREESVTVPKIRKKFSTRFQGAKALLDGFGSHGEGEATRSEIDLVIRLHIGEEMTKLMTALDQLQREAQKQLRPQ
jgi:predicted nucleotidyltransferase